MAVLLVLVTAPGIAGGCASAPASGSDSGDPTAEGAKPDSIVGEAAADSAETVSDTANVAPVDQTIPPAYMPPPGQCRAWRPGEAPEEQAGIHPVGRCSELRRSLPEGTWLIYRPPDASGIVRVWRYGEEGGVVSQRIHDAATGELLRHVAPAGS